MSALLLYSGLLAFVVALLAPLPFIRRPNTRSRLVSYYCQLIGDCLFLALSLSVLAYGQTLRVGPYPIVPGAGITFVVDRLAAFFIFPISLVALSAGIYSLKYENDGSTVSRNLAAPLASIFVMSMMLVVASADTFSLLFFWETMSISSFFLVMSNFREPLTQKSGLFYFIMTQMSTVFLLFGFLAMYGFSGTFNIQPLTGVPGLAKGLVFASLFIGFGIKAGVVPFHKWLPYAHSASPSSISALMSGVMIKVAIYGIVRFVLFTLSPDLWWGMVILAFGSVSALLGVIYALKEHDLKKLLAYHSIENIGIILLGIGLSIIFQAHNLPDLAMLALAGGLFHTLNHALFKGLLFLAAGSVVHVTGTRNIEEMGGLVKRMPATAVLFLIGSASISALPPFNGFVSELMIFQTFFQSYRVAEPFTEVLLFVALAMFALTSALAAACFVKAFGTVFLANPRSKEAEKAAEVPAAMIVGPAILAALCMLLGVFSFQVFSLAGYSFNTPNLLPVVAAMTVFLAAAVALATAMGRRKARVSETWGCGLTSQNSRMEYTASGFSQPILTIFRPIYRTSIESHRRFFDRDRALFKSGAGAIRTFKLFEERIYMPVAQLVKRFSEIVANSQDVDLDTHVLYAFVSILLLLMVVWWVL